MNYYNNLESFLDGRLRCTFCVLFSLNCLEMDGISAILIDMSDMDELRSIFVFCNCSFRLTNFVCFNPNDLLNIYSVQYANGMSKVA